MKASDATIAELLRPADRATFCRAGSSSAHQPCLISFETSIVSRLAFDKTGAASLVPRRQPHLGARIFRAICGPSASKTRANIRLFRQSLRSCECPIVLVVGGGTIGNGVESLYTAEDVCVVGFDVYASSHTHFVADAHDIPLKDQSCDAVVVQAVLEHVLSPAVVVAEIRRVLKPGGVVYAETPFLQHVHEGAYDFTRFTHSGHRWLFRDFEEIASGATKGLGTQLLWSIDYFVRGVFRSQMMGKVARMPFFWLRFFDGWIPESFNIDGASGCYFLGRKGAGLYAADMVAYYRGHQRL